MGKRKQTPEEIMEALLAQISGNEGGMLPDFHPEMIMESETNQVDFDPNTLAGEEFDLLSLIGDENELGESLEAMQERGWFENFADDIDESVKNSICQELLMKITDDEESRKPWEKALVTTLKTVGIAQNLDKDSLSSLPFENASQAEFPMLAKAMVQFQSRAIAEILPDNPVKAILIGDSTPERVDQERRVEASMNYQLDFLDQGFFNDYKKMMIYLPLAGSTFRKVYHDPILEQNITRFVKPQDFIIHYDQVSLDNCDRYTHRMFLSQNELRKMQYLGFYSNIDVGEGEIQYDRDIVTEQIEKEDGYVPGKAYHTSEDGRHIVLEVHCNLDIPGFEHMDEYGEPTGIALPYVVTIDHTSAKMLSIRKNYKQNDNKFKKIIWFVHYQFLPGLGFYGFGYAHLIGSIARASTSLLRAMLDGTALHLLKGGFKTSDAKIDGDTCLAPGEYRTVEGTFDDIRKSFYPIEYSAPSPQVIQIIQYMDKVATEVVSTTEVMVGSASNTGPVGTTLALIEQSQKVYTSIHKSLHRSFGQELRLLADLNFEYFPDQFEFDSPEGKHFVYRSDFDGSVRVIPVSDPNISSFQQRQAVDQATLQMAMQFPQFFKMDKVVRRIMKNLNVVALDEIMYTEDELREQEQQAAMQQEQQMQMQQQQLANIPNPIEEKLAVEQQKLQGDMALNDQKFQQEQQLKEQEFLQQLELDKQQSQNDAILRSRDLASNNFNQLADLLGY